MNSTHEALPIPPPLPSHKKGLARKCCCAPTPANNALDRLFDDGYRADVSISTDYGGLIYAHASILVSFGTDNTFTHIHLTN